MKIKCFYWCILLFAVMGVGGYSYLYFRWRHLWALEPPRQLYQIVRHQDDTLRVVMIGDSWAGMHRPFDDFMQAQLQKLSADLVLFESKGKGGEKTKGVYQLMFEKSGYGTKSFIACSPDYCIISAGINDAAANLGEKQYCYYYCQIVELLLNNHIKPVVLDFPDVNMWTIYQEKPFKNLCSDFMRSMMTHCGMYDYSGYREALKSILEKNGLMDSVLYIPICEWYGASYEVNFDLFLEDQIHLNSRGYKLLDICLARNIAKDYNNRRMPHLSISQ